MTIDQYKDKCEELIIKRLVSLGEKIVNQEDLSENDFIWYCIADYLKDKE